MGDEIQAIKAGLLEVADIVVVNKGDRPGAQRTAAQLRAMLTAAARIGQGTRHHAVVTAAPDVAATDPSPAPSDGRPRPKQPQVLVTTALTGDGVPELLSAIDRQRAVTSQSADAAARLVRAEAQVWAILGDRIRDRLATEREAATRSTLAAVAAHELDPFTAADRLLASLGLFEREG